MPLKNPTLYVYDPNSEIDPFELGGSNKPGLILQFVV